MWSAAFDLAWKEARDHVFHEPLRLQNMCDDAERLNRSTSSTGDLLPDNLYVKAGFIKDGILDAINQEVGL